MRGDIILGSAVTGAKFTPRNHAKTGNPFIDLVSQGQTIKSDVGQLVAEAAALFDIGVRYYHYHARNPVTQEQSTANSLYWEVSLAVQDRLPGMLISFGASRNGVEVKEAIQRHGEWERISQAALPLHLGGAHFVTSQAAVELQVVLDMERNGHGIGIEAASRPEFARLVRHHVPSTRDSEAGLDVHSTSGGANYGSTSPHTQFEVYRKAIDARRRLHLLHEVEWVQLDRSYAMTRFATENPLIGLGSEGQLNITLLFGFSPRFPFPENYAEFRRAVSLAKSLEYDLSGRRVRNVTISAGAAVLPQHAQAHVKALEFGSRKGQLAGPMERLACYAAQADSEVDVIRSGMEDTPYIVTPAGEVTLTDNLGLAHQVKAMVESCGSEVLADKCTVRRRMGFDTLSRTVEGQPVGATAS
ncbi:hypothetical protein AO501_18650 [Mycobacterium gordonae]|uniref:3-keto-5-aminohexanoate cleavage protein n=1 Tax=Mycobacterium gordonae TaxID=1778 RepID=A0A0Q2U5I5_MYCGO|nr:MULTISPECIES: hypothetical protein [Mycobacterium]KQH76040.1 hypothetical protein AO501_18650 [Mycobacterium gordonae]MDP7727499.1 hypothetical protein [Mycobacterium sp. TY813]